MQTAFDNKQLLAPTSAAPAAKANATRKTELRIALLTGGSDKPYALGLATALTTRGVLIDFIGSNNLDIPEFHSLAGLSFFNLRGDQSPTAHPFRKVFRILTYYVRLTLYTFHSRADVFHILWNNRFEVFDRTLLMFFYRLKGKRLVLTAHNINAGKRDGTDSWLNRFSLGIQYRVADHIFVHTLKMKEALIDEFRVPGEKISVIRLGVNNTVPNTTLTPADARTRLGLAPHERVLLFFGRISPYKGLEFLLSAVERLRDPDYRLLIVGSVQNSPEYWHDIARKIATSGLEGRILQRIEFVPDQDTELYFKAADALVLPYVQVFQSGVLVLAYSFGLPVLAADTGSLAEDVVTGKTGYVFRPCDAEHLAETIAEYFRSPLYHNLPTQREMIREHVNHAYSWDLIGRTTVDVYSRLQRRAA